MRRLPSWVWLLTAVAFAILAAVMALGWLKRQAAHQASLQPKSTLVVVAKIPVGSANLLTKAQLQVDVWHQAKAPPGSFRRLDQVIGRVTASPLIAGELITAKKLAPKGTVPGITALLSPEHRAMTVKVDEASGVAGFLSPGDRVDVVVTVDRGGFSKDPFARLLFQNLKVLGTGQKLENRPGDKPQIVPTVTLEVTPQEGERLALAAQTGRISLVLRAHDDSKMVRTAGVEASQLFGKPEKPAPKAAAPTPAAAPRKTVKVIRGLEQAPITF
jgi:pilus assembly protein CpaB